MSFSAVSVSRRRLREFYPLVSARGSHSTTREQIISYPTLQKPHLNVRNPTSSVNVTLTRRSSIETTKQTQAASSLRLDVSNVMVSSEKTARELLMVPECQMTEEVLASHYFSPLHLPSPALGTPLAPSSQCGRTLSTPGCEDHHTVSSTLRQITSGPIPSSLSSSTPVNLTKDTIHSALTSSTSSVLSTSERLHSIPPLLSRTFTTQTTTSSHDSPLPYTPSSTTSSVLSNDSASSSLPLPPHHHHHATLSSMRNHSTLIGRRVHSLAQSLTRSSASTFSSSLSTSLSTSTSASTASSTLSRPPHTPLVRSFHTHQPLHSAFKTSTNPFVGNFGNFGNFNSKNLGGNMDFNKFSGMFGGHRGASGNPNSGNNNNTGNRGNNERRGRHHSMEEDWEKKAGWQWLLEAFLLAPLGVKATIIITAMIAYYILSFLINFLISVGFFLFIIAMLTRNGRTSIVRNIAPIIDYFGLHSVSGWLYRVTGTIPRAPSTITGLASREMSNGMGEIVKNVIYTAYLLSKTTCMNYVVKNELVNNRTLEAVTKSEKARSILGARDTDVIDFSHNYTSPIDLETANLAPKGATEIYSYGIRVGDKEVGTLLIFLADDTEKLEELSEEELDQVRREFRFPTWMMPRVISVAVEMGPTVHQLGTLVDIEKGNEEEEDKRKEEESVPEAQFYEIKKDNKKP